MNASATAMSGTLLFAALCAGLVTAGEPTRPGAPFRPRQVPIADLKGDSGTLYEAANTEVRGFTVVWRDWQRQPTDQALLRVYGNGVSEGVISGFPKPEATISERYYGEKEYSHSVAGRMEFGGVTFEVIRTAGGAVAAILVNGKEQPLYDGAYAPRISSNGKHFTYSAVSKQDKKQFTVIDGRKGVEYDWCTGVVFSPDGNRYAYMAGDGPNVFAVVDGVVGTTQPCEARAAVITEPSFGYHSLDGSELISWSPDSRRLLYILPPKSLTTTGRFYMDGEAISPLEGQMRRSLWSKDGSRFVYATRSRSKEALVLDGVILEDHGAIRDLAFSPDGKRFAYIAWDSHMGLPPCRVICDGQAGPEFFDPAVVGKISWAHNLAAVVFSRDSKHLAYVSKGSNGEEGKNWCVVLDGRKLQSYDDILTIPVFRADKVLYIAVVKGQDTTKVVQVAERIE
jgi:WD40 repeat protein